MREKYSIIGSNLPHEQLTEWNVWRTASSHQVHIFAQSHVTYLNTLHELPEQYILSQAHIINIFRKLTDIRFNSLD